MAKVFIEETTLTAIGDAIRGKTGKTELIDPANMSTEIASIEAGGGGGYEPPESTFALTGDISYRFYLGRWDWFIEQYGDRFTTEGIHTGVSTFASSKVKEIPFQINVTADAAFGTNLAAMFASCEGLEVCPKIRGNIGWANSSTSFDDIFQYCEKLKDLEDAFTPEMMRGFTEVPITKTSWRKLPKFYGCSSLRRIPSWWYELQMPKNSTSMTTASNSLYSSLCPHAFSLDEIRDIPVWATEVAITSNMFLSCFSNTHRLKAITFATNPDGSPIEAKWKSQTIDLTSQVGYSPYQNLADYGFTQDTRITNDETYQALKDNPDSWTMDYEYSRYNRASAVETINSLPDTSAYLASAGGTNTIKFTRLSGQYTDGYAIGSLKAEEIAVATAKGWTVTIL